MTKRQKKLARENKHPHAITMSRELFSGPLPPPKILAEYESILPGSTDRIIAMAEKQQDHRQKQENKVIGSNVESEKRGQHMSFVITLVALLAGGLLVYNNKQIAGFITLMGTLGFHAANFAYQKYRERKELRRRKEEENELSK